MCKTPDALDEIFSNLSRWRHLPGYQLERRLDIFFTPYLRTVLETRFGPLSRTLVPEMPIRQCDSNLSDKVDYVAFSADGATAFLIELKTDQASTRGKQFEYLDRCAAKAWRDTLLDLKQIIRGTKAKRKYGHLLALLADANQVALGANAISLHEKGRMAEFEITSRVDAIKIVFIAPSEVGEQTTITFPEIIAALPTASDPVAEHLARLLDACSHTAGRAAWQSKSSC